MTYGVPQVIMIVIMALTLILGIINHGEVKVQKENFWVTLISVIINYVILKAGGFF